MGGIPSGGPPEEYFGALGCGARMIGRRACADEFRGLRRGLIHAIGFDPTSLEKNHESVPEVQVRVIRANGLFGPGTAVPGL